MKWFAILPIRLTNGRLAWLRWVGCEVVDYSEWYTPIFRVEYSEMEKAQ